MSTNELFKNMVKETTGKKDSSSYADDTSYNQPAKRVRQGYSAQQRDGSQAKWRIHGDVEYPLKRPWGTLGHRYS